MTITERATVAVFGVLLACIFGVLLAWIIMAVPAGTDKREGYWTDPETGEQVKVLKSRPVPITTPWVGFMLIGRDERLSQQQ